MHRYADGLFHWRKCYWIMDLYVSQKRWLKDKIMSSCIYFLDVQLFLLMKLTDGLEWCGLL